MEKKGKHHGKHRRRSGNSRPHWLFMGALAASTALGGRATAYAYMPAHHDGPLLPVRRIDAPLDSKDAALAALLDAIWSEKLTPADMVGGDRPARPGDATPNQDLTVRRFDIAPGPLGAALVVYEEMTGLRVEIPREAIRGLSSPGVSGLFTAEQALRELLAETGVTYRFSGARTVTLELQMLSETVDVTARPNPSSPKYTEPLRDIPQTLSVVPRTVMEEQGATTLREVLRNVTGISIQAGEGGGGLPGDNLAIRGFAARSDIYVDGVRDFGAYSRDTFNIEQVEVAKGPASIYGGRGSTGGSLNLSSKTPHLITAHDVTFGAGSDSFGRATVDVNQPIEALEGAALRLNAMWSQGDTPGRDAVENQRWGLAPSLAFGLGTPTRVTLSYSHLAQGNVPDYGIPWVPNTNVPLAEHADQPAPVDFENFYGLKDRDYEETVTGIATAAVEHDLTASTTLRSLVRHGESTRDSIITAPRFAAADSTLITRQLQSRDLEDSILAWQTDLRSTVRTGSIEHELVTGVEAARETSENFSRTGPAAPPTDLFNPNPDDPYLGPITRTGARTEATADTAAVYAADTIKLNEQWQINAGLRWDRFDMNYESVAVDGVVIELEREDDPLSWRTGVVYKPRPNGSVYAAYGTSFNLSAEGNTGLSLSTSTVDLAPEESRGFEVGTKWDLLDARLSLSSAVFRTEKTNARTPGINPGDPATVLDGVQRVSGFEVGVTGSITRDWNAFFGYTYMDSEILESNNAAEVGHELGNTPEHSMSLWTTYRIGTSFELGGGAQLVGDRFNGNSGARIAPSYWLFDAMASYDLSERLTLRLNATNLADEKYIDRVGGGHFIPGTGRSVALTTAVKL
ncbi:MAG TPA: TonB-dependent siderophore receptor [Thermoanaerobaculia bacterium]|nr:TonB-dependent siderophore receptor [Thermoanaerobaculia bacterium]